MVFPASRFISGGMIALTSVKMRCENSELLWKPKTRSLSSRVISTDLNKLIWCVDFPDFHEIGQNVCQILMHQSKLGVKKSKYYSSDVRSVTTTAIFSIVQLHVPSVFHQRTTFSNNCKLGNRWRWRRCTWTDQWSQEIAWVPIFLDVMNKRTSFA